jgi:hypothetical protein
LSAGAITYGEHYMEEKFVFGPALIEAVNLEKKDPYPRVVLSAEAPEVNREITRRFYASKQQTPMEEELVCDEDDVVFVNHLALWLGEEDNWRVVERDLPHYKKVIEAALTEYADAEDDEDKKRWGKWKWLADYHNHALTTVFKDPEPFLLDAGEPLHSFYPFSDTIEMPPPPPPGPGWRDDEFLT